MGEETVHALRGVSLQIRSNEYLAMDTGGGPLARSEIG